MTSNSMNVLMLLNTKYKVFIWFHKYRLLVILVISLLIVRSDKNGERISRYNETGISIWHSITEHLHPDHKNQRTWRNQNLARNPKSGNWILIRLVGWNTKFIKASKAFFSTSGVPDWLKTFTHSKFQNLIRGMNKFFRKLIKTEPKHFKNWFEQNQTMPVFFFQKFK